MHRLVLCAAAQAEHHERENKQGQVFHIAELSRVQRGMVVRNCAGAISD
jgi:hypothetical protein